MITYCELSDLPQILILYQAARALQTQRQMVVWPTFDNQLMITEIEERRQLKIIEDNSIVCNWAITYEDKAIWEAKDLGDAIYIHRICNHPAYRGRRYIHTIVDWAKTFAKQKGKKFIRLDTLGNNTKLIEHYTSAGFEFLGMYKLTDTSSLPKHYQDEPNCCLFEIMLK